MKRMKPIQIKEFTPLTEPEMKSIFGGSGESGESGEAWCLTGRPCNISISESPDKPSVQIAGVCRVTYTSGMGRNVSNISNSSCNCSVNAPLSGTIIGNDPCNKR